MPTITISISADLKKRLDRHKTAFNVSGVCQEAIEREVRICEVSAMEGLKMAERLQAQSEGEGDTVRAEGRESGVGWATKHADWSELRMLEDFIRNRETEHDQYQIDNDVLEPASPDEWSERKGKRFFEEWRQGFIDGALKAFDEALEDMD